MGLESAHTYRHTIKGEREKPAVGDGRDPEERQGSTAGGRQEAAPAKNNGEEPSVDG